MEENSVSRKKIAGGFFVGVVIVLFVVINLICWKRIPAGYAGVIYNMNGGVVGEVRDQGYTFVTPNKRLTKYTIGIEQSYLTSLEQGDSPNDDSFEVPSKDGKGLRVDLTFTYRFDRDKLADTFTRFKGKSGDEVKSYFIKPNVISWVKEITAQYSVTDILSDKRSALNLEICEYLKGKFEPYGIVIENASFIDINPDEETRKAVQKKVTAQQEKELAEIEAETARINAEKEKKVALITAEKNKETAAIQAEQEKIKAKGEADAKEISSKAEAAANARIAKSLTPELIEKIKLGKWDGSVPQVQGSSTPIVDMTGN